LDETGWFGEERKQKNKYVITEEIEKTQYIKQNNKQPTIMLPKMESETKLSLVACISLNGDYVPPYIITQRKTLSSEIVDTYGNDCMKFHSQKSAFCDEECFLDWINSCFSPLCRRKEKNS